LPLLDSYNIKWAADAAKPNSSRYFREEREANKAYGSALAAAKDDWSAANEMVVPAEFDAAIEEGAISAMNT